MPSFSNAPIPDLLRDARDLYTNARDDAEVFAVLSAEPWGFTAADFDAGLALVAAVEASSTALRTEALESQEATDAYAAATDAVRAAFVRHRGLIRKRYPQGTPVYGALRLQGDLPDNREALLAAADTFYGALAPRADVIAAVRGVTDAAIADARALVATATAAGTAQTREKGDLDRAGATHRGAVEALRTHASLTAADCKEALADHPQLRERLGLLERS